MNDNHGIVYVLKNSAMPGLVKIGMTTRNDIELRMKELYSTGVPVPFECVYACEVKVSDCAKIEKALHKAFAPNRVNDNREFFRIDAEQATVVLELFNKKEITEEVAAGIESDLTTEDKDAGEKIKISRRPTFNFSEMGIPVGATLNFVNNSDEIAIVVSDKIISYNGSKTSLTAITRLLLDAPRNVAPTRYWEYDGRNLRDIYDETYPFSE